MITKELSMAQVILDHQQLIPLLPRFNIKMGVGEASVEEVCKHHSVDVDFFLEICNAYIHETFDAQHNLSVFSLDTVINYLENTHIYYTEIALPELERQIHSLISGSDLSKEKKELVITFFNDYKHDFLGHIQKEELEIIPYIRELEEQSGTPEPDADFIIKMKAYSIGDFAREHDPLENSLTNLSKLIIKYLPPFKNWGLCNHILGDLSRLVKDLVDHAEIEDRVLIPRVAELEKELVEKSRKSQ